MPRWEVTGERPSEFSRWHRAKLPDWCWLADGDWWFVRHGHVVAFVETIQIAPDHFNEAGKWIVNDPWQKCWYPQYDARYPLWETKKIVFNYIFAVTRLRAFIIYHTPKMQQVRVIDYRKKCILDFNEADFAQWLQML